MTAQWPATDSPRRYPARALFLPPAFSQSEQLPMRKVRDYDTELKALGDKARALDLLGGGLLHVIAQAQVIENREA